MSLKSLNRTRTLFPSYDRSFAYNHSKLSPIACANLIVVEFEENVKVSRVNLSKVTLADVLLH